MGVLLAPRGACARVTPPASISGVGPCGGGVDCGRMPTVAESAVRSDESEDAEADGGDTVGGRGIGPTLPLGEDSQSREIPPAVSRPATTIAAAASV